MTQSQINYFLAVAEDHSITRAANRLYVSQPAISKSIAAFEKELGFSLFTRQDNALSLTYAGTQLYEFFSRSKDEFHGLLKQIEERSGLAATTLRIGCPSNWNPEKFYPKILRHFSDAHNHVALTIECFPLPEMINMLKNKQLDLVLMMGLRELAMIGLESQQITSTQCGILYSKKRFPEVSSLRDFSTTQFLGSDSNVRDLFENMIRDSCEGEFSPKFKHCANYPTSVFELSLGNGVMLYIDWDIAVCSELFAFFPLDTWLPIHALYLEENHVAAEVAKELSEIFTS